MLFKVSSKLTAVLFAVLVLLMHSCDKAEECDTVQFTLCGESIRGAVAPFERSCSNVMLYDSMSFQARDFDNQFFLGDDYVSLDQELHRFEIKNVCQLEPYLFNVYVKCKKGYDVHSFNLFGSIPSTEKGNFNQSDVLNSGYEVDSIKIDTVSSSEYNLVNWSTRRLCQDGRYPFIHPDSIFDVTLFGYFSIRVAYSENKDLSVQQFYDNVLSIKAVLQAPKEED